MKRGFIICLLIFGLSRAAEDNVGSETKELSKATNNINFRFIDKNKRGATKITNTDNPSFNSLSVSNAASNTASNTASNSNVGFKASNSPFIRYLYNQQYYQPNPYLTYFQLPQAAQIAAQYSLQSNPVAHFLQTPTQIQYVATPTVAHVPQIKYQTLSNELLSGTAANADSASSSTTSSQYVPQSQQTSVSPSQTFVSSASSSGSSSNAINSQTKQVQIPLYVGQNVQPVYYTQHPLFTYFQQPQATNFIYQPPNSNYLLGHQQQVSSIYGANKFGLYTSPQNAQLTYLVPMVVSKPEQNSGVTATSSLKSADKTLSNTQQSSNSFTFGTKA